MYVVNIKLSFLFCCICLTTSPGLISQNYIWANSIGGTANDYGYRIAIDPLGNVVVAGTFLNTIEMYG